MVREDQEKYQHDIIDEDLYEEFDDEELYELVQEEKRKALERAKVKDNEPTKRPFPKWVFFIIAFALLFNVVALLPQTFSIPAIDFLVTSAKLSVQEDIRTYKEAVVVIETGDSKGTGFSISSEGLIITNDHVVKGEEVVTVAFPNDGLYQGTVIENYPEIDLAIVEIDEQDMPYLNLADETTYEENEEITFIGNPLRFNGIANEGEIIGSIQLSSWDVPVFMLDAPVYRGNSGSPVITQKGEVIGIIFATLDHDTHGRVGLFVPIDYYYKLAQ